MVAFLIAAADEVNPISSKFCIDVRRLQILERMAVLERGL